jgi:hypothetical protein
MTYWQKLNEQKPLMSKLVLHVGARLVNNNHNWVIYDNNEFVSDQNI